MSFATMNTSSVSTTYGGGLADMLKDETLNGWWEVPPYSVWDLRNRFACSQSTLVSRRSHDVTEKLRIMPTVIPTVHSMQSSADESQNNNSNNRVSFSMGMSPSQAPANNNNNTTATSSTTDFATGKGTDMGRAYRMHTLLNNPTILQKYHEAAKMTDDPEVQFEFAKQLLLCGSTDMASNPRLLDDANSANSKMVREGVFWIKRLANNKRHHKGACFLVGRWYELGKYGCKPSTRKALKYYSWAAKSNHKAAHYHMGIVYEMSGKLRKARECYEQASKCAFSLATHRLGLAYLSGSLGVTADFNMACSFLRESLFHTSHPVADAGYHLALALIQLPTFNKQSISEPHLYLKRAWMLGHADAGALLHDLFE
ncbi:hypothetical protein GGI23_006169 [Coemansia sp. RSA 2559]|nr:hypothetical protein GGI23_006169 [Coemansia sp. RSA 2559]KAJ2856750.1 hypothetical protein GGI22_003718 [Coemansia erecta]